MGFYKIENILISLLVVINQMYPFLHQEAINNKENYYLKVIHEMNFYFNILKKYFQNIILIY